MYWILWRYEIKRERRSDLVKPRCWQEGCSAAGSNYMPCCIDISRRYPPSLLAIWSSKLPSYRQMSVAVSKLARASGNTWLRKKGPEPVSLHAFKRWKRTNFCVYRYCGSRGRPRETRRSRQFIAASIIRDFNQLWRHKVLFILLAKHRCPILQFLLLPTKPIPKLMPTTVSGGFTPSHYKTWVPCSLRFHTTPWRQQEIQWGYLQGTYIYSWYIYI